MNHIDTIRDALPDVAKDIRLNLQAVLQESTLSVEQRWGVAVAAAYAMRNKDLRKAIVSDASAVVPVAILEDAAAAAALMAMNNVYYRFRHIVGKESYGQKPARLRMNRMVKPASTKKNFELFSLAVSAISNCQMCVQSHEKVVTEEGLSEDQVHDAIRIAATIAAAAVSLEMAD